MKDSVEGWGLGGASTEVTSYIHAHVVFNMRHKEEKKKRSLGASLCYAIAFVTFLIWMMLFLFLF